MGVYALGTIAGPHPILSPGEGKEFETKRERVGALAFAGTQEHPHPALPLAGEGVRQ